MEEIQSADDLIGLSLGPAAEIIGVTSSRLQRWADEFGLVEPIATKHFSERNTVRIYGFTQLVEARVVMELRHRGHSLYKIKKIINEIRSRGYGAPLSEFVWADAGSRIVFQWPDGTWSDEINVDQVVMREVIDLDEIRASIRNSLSEKNRRSAEGLAERRRGVMGSTEVFSGTRTPVSAVVNFLNRGATDSEILEAYPHLTERDIAFARERLAAA